MYQMAVLMTGLPDRQRVLDKLIMFMSRLPTDSVPESISRRRSSSTRSSIDEVKMLNEALILQYPTIIDKMDGAIDKMDGAVDEKLLKKWNRLFGW